MKAEIVALLEIVNKLQQKYPKRKFTLDGRLVGDIGEILIVGFVVPLGDKARVI